MSTLRQESGEQVYVLKQAYEIVRYQKKRGSQQEKSRSYKHNWVSMDG
jgi:hypothetical protein